MKLLSKWVIVFCLLFGFSQLALALFPTTAKDLDLLRDILSFEFEKDPNLYPSLVPVLVATPKHHWVESREDFVSATYEALQTVFKNESDLIYCQDCDTFRLHTYEKQRLHINNGELSLMEIAALKKEHRYGNAKSLMTISETTGGISIRIINLNDGRVLFSRLVDSNRSLDDHLSWTPYAAEVERRQRGESLSYVFINLGVYPNPLFQIEWVEQWGSYNQHISGVGFSLIGPIGAIGGVYHYLLPSIPKLHISTSLYYPLQNLAESLNKETKSNVAKQFVLQGMVQYTFGSTFGLFVAANTDSTFSLGMNFYNPLLMPFLF